MTRNSDVKIRNARLYLVETVVWNLTFPYHVKVIPLNSHLISEHAKEHTLSAKHQVEEAMSKALIQKCNKCAKPFVKLMGCNKMTCTCGNLQCYVCGENITGYQHFETKRKDGTKCVLHENDDHRLVQKIQAAQADAVKKVLEERGHELKEDDIKVDAPEVARPAHPGLPMPFNMPNMAAQFQEVHRQAQQARLQMQQMAGRFPGYFNAPVILHFCHCLILGWTSRFCCSWCSRISTPSTSSSRTAT